MSYYIPLVHTQQFKRLYAVGQKIILPEFVIYWHVAIKQSVSNLDNKNNELPKLNSTCLRLAFVASRKVGNAVKRNRCKRRLRALFYPYFKQLHMLNMNIAFVARHKLLTAPFEKLKHHMEKFIQRILGARL